MPNQQINQAAVTLAVAETGEIILKVPEKQAVFTPAQARELGIGLIERAAVGAAYMAQNLQKGRKK